VVDEQDLAGMNDEDRDSEINFFVEVSHGFVEPLNRESLHRRK
jgi:hypothetical protein